MPDRTPQGVAPTVTSAAATVRYTPRTAHLPHIDGLRGLAVISVLLFHVDAHHFQGGFVGVDVFFVISGFLITRLVTTEVAAGSFTFSQFYVRRLRRLAPGLLFVLLLTVIVAAALLSPARLRETLGAAVHATWSTANIYFHSEVGYFDSEAGVKPLLHTWSLSVEEQFYLVWPAVLALLLTRLPRWAVIAVIAALALVSLAGSESLARTEPASAFFLAHLRAFELCIGALAVWLPEPQIPRGWLAEVVAISGLALIGYATLFFSRDTVFPGIRALAPCVGCACIAVGGGAARAAAMLRTRAAVAIGSISYSLYLLHWPLIVFYRYSIHDALTGPDQIGLCLGSIAIAGLAYHWVERRYRYSPPSALARSKQFGLACAVVGATITGVAAHGWLGDGWLWRYPKAIQRAVSAEIEVSGRAFSWRAVAALPARFADDGRPKILVIGDSQGADFVNLLVHGHPHVALDLVMISSRKQCQILFSPSAYDHRSAEDRSCVDLNRRIADDARIAAADTVVLAFAWFPATIPFLAEDVAQLTRRGARRIALLGRKDQVESGAEILSRTRRFDGAETWAAHRRRPEAEQVNQSIRALHLPIVFLDLMSVMCWSAARCHVVDTALCPLLFDRRHFTEAGARFIGPRFLDRSDVALVLQQSSR